MNTAEPQFNSAVKMLEYTAGRFGGKIAIEDENGMITFSGLREKSLNMAAALLETRNAPVIIYLPKSINTIISFMGTLYSGNYYVPVDVNMPLTRLEKIFENLKPAHIITDHAHIDALNEINVYGASIHTFSNISEELYTSDIFISDGQPLISAIYERIESVTDTDPIYIMYTSGSTGVPKGVTVSHRGVVDYAKWVRETFDISEQTIFGTQSAFYFDNSILDIYSCLYTGAKMVIIPETFFMYPNMLPEYIDQKEVNTIFWVPTVLINVANLGVLSGGMLPHLKKVLFCGEVMPNKQLNIWRKAFPDILYANLYGPTEITDVCTYYIIDREFEDNDPLPIGKPCKNMKAIILTEEETAAKSGETGELCIGGSGVSLGYYNNKDITDRVFIQNPLNPYYSERIYRTGDLAYIAEDGLIMYVGRMDSQIKLKGNRIELGEIENAVKSLPIIENACVLFDTENQEITAFVQSKENINARKLNLELKKFIPAYMLPGKLIVMDALPLTQNGKIDRIKLKTSFTSK